MPKLDPNATVVERIQYYVAASQHEKAKALATLADFLEECYLWDITFDSEYS